MVRSLRQREVGLSDFFFGKLQKIKQGKKGGGGGNTSVSINSCFFMDTVLSHK